MSKIKLSVLVAPIFINIWMSSSALADPTKNPTDIPTDPTQWTTGAGVAVPQGPNDPFNNATGDSDPLTESSFQSRSSALNLNMDTANFNAPFSGDEARANLQGQQINVPTGIQQSANNNPLYYGGWLFIPPSWSQPSTSTLIDTQLWGVMSQNPSGGGLPFYASIGFSNVDYPDTGAGPTPIAGDGAIYYYNVNNQNTFLTVVSVDTPVVDSGFATDDNPYNPYDPATSAIKYGAWNHLVSALKFNDPNTDGNGTGLYYYLNGKQIAFSDVTNNEDVDPNVNQITNLYTMAVNRNVQYNSYWSEISVGQAVLPGTTLQMENLYGANGSGGTTTQGDVIIFPTGTLQGSGTIFGMGHNYGTIMPGTNSNPYGNLIITNGYRGTDDDVPVMVFNVFFGNQSTSKSNVIFINGPITGDPTSVQVINQGGGGSATGHGPGHGILLIDVSGAPAGSTHPGDFFLAGGSINIGPYVYKLYLESDNRWYLESNGVTAATSLYTALPQITKGYGFSLLDTLHRRNGGKMNNITGDTVNRVNGKVKLLNALHEDDNRTAVNDNGAICSKDSVDGKCVWSRVIAEHGVRKSKNYTTKGPDYDYNLYILQVGSDLYYKQNENGSRDSSGLYLAAGNTDSHVKQTDLTKAGKIKFDGYTLGAYWTHYGNEEWYVDSVIQGTKYDRIKTSSVDGYNLSSKGWNIAASLEGGYPLKLIKDNWLIEPQAQVIVQKTSINKSSDLTSLVSFGNNVSVTGRIGQRIAKTWVNPDNRYKSTEAWLSLDVIHEFNGKTKTSMSFSDGANPESFYADSSGTSGRIGIGIKSKLEGATSLHATADYQRSFTDNSYSYSGRAGIQIKF